MPISAFSRRSIAFEIFFLPASDLLGLGSSEDLASLRFEEVPDFFGFGTNEDLAEVEKDLVAKMFLL